MATSHKVSKRDARTLEAIFRHPVARNLAWSDALHLIEGLGAVRQEPNGRLVFAINEHRDVFHQPHDKELTADEIARLRKFLEGAGVRPGAIEVIDEDRKRESATADMVVAVDHHQARLFTIEGSSETARTLRPYDPHHFLHHLSHRQERELRGQREGEESSYYAEIAAALAPAGRIVVLGHGTGHSNAAAHLEQVLRSRYPEIFSRVMAIRAVDLSATSEPQLLALALQTLDSLKGGSSHGAAS
jgi:hypothetical protein